MSPKVRPVPAWLFCLLILFLSVRILACPSASSAAEVIFTIDPSQSTINWTGSYNGMAFEPQSPGSLSAPISGHFLVDFDPATNVPSSIQFIGGHGYYEPATLYVAQPAVGGGPGSAPANMAGQAGDAVWAIRDLVWDFSSEPIAGSNGAFDAGQTRYTILSGRMDHSVALQGGTMIGSGIGNSMTGGSWTLSESSPGSGEWTLVGTPYHHYSQSFAVPPQALFTVAANVVAQAQYGAANRAVVQPTDTYAEALGGAAAVGGVSVDFNQSTGGGTFSVQQVPNETGLSQAAIAAAAANPVFALSTSSLTAAPQIWEVDFSGDLEEGVLATLLFHYDSSLLPPGLDESTLGIWHYDSIASRWDFGGTVDPVADTIAFTTGSFSPFQLGVASVPEPSTAMLSVCALLGLAGWYFRRRNDRS